MKLSWHKFYPSEFLSATNHLTPDRVGVFMRLSSYYWQMDILPNDMDRLMEMCSPRNRTKKLREAIQEVLDEFFILEDDGGGYTCPKIDSEYERCKERHSANVEKGRKGANARYGQSNETHSRRTPRAF